MAEEISIKKKYLVVVPIILVLLVLGFLLFHNLGSSDIATGQVSSDTINEAKKNSLDVQPINLTITQKKQVKDDLFLKINSVRLNNGRNSLNRSSELDRISQIFAEGDESYLYDKLDSEEVYYYYASGAVSVFYLAGMENLSQDIINDWLGDSNYGDVILNESNLYEGNPTFIQWDSVGIGFDCQEDICIAVAIFIQSELNLPTIKPPKITPPTIPDFNIPEAPQLPDFPPLPTFP